MSRRPEKQTLLSASLTRYGTFSLSGTNTSQAVNTEIMIVMTMRSIIQKILGYRNLSAVCSLVDKLIMQPELAGLLLSLKEHIRQHPKAKSDVFVRDNSEKIKQIKDAMPSEFSIEFSNLMLKERLTGKPNEHLLSQLLVPFANAFELEEQSVLQKSAL